MGIQLEVLKRIDSSIWLEPGRKQGDVVWVNSADAARHLIEAGFCRLQEFAQGEFDATKILRRSDSVPYDRFAVVNRAWEGKTVVCIGGGPSLSEAAIARVRASGCPVIAVNDAYLIAPFADVCYFADFDWWKRHQAGEGKRWPWARFNTDEARIAFANFAGQKCTIEGTGMMVADPAVYMLHNLGTSGLSVQSNGLHTGLNSGYQSINLAFLAGAQRIVLVAYDMRYIAGRTHSHNGHPSRMPEDVYAQNYARVFPTMMPQLEKAGVEVINTSLDSAIQCFAKVPLESVLPNT